MELASSSPMQYTLRVVGRRPVAAAASAEPTSQKAPQALFFHPKEHHLISSARFFFLHLTETQREGLVRVEREETTIYTIGTHHHHHFPIGAAPLKNALRTTSNKREREREKTRRVFEIHIVVENVYLPTQVCGQNRNGMSGVCSRGWPDSLIIIEGKRETCGNRIDAGYLQKGFRRGE